MGKIEAPYSPIIYVRGYAGTDDEVEDTVADPYMGFNLGSTKLRTVWTGDTERYYFESPLVRLMKDFRYADVYSAGLDLSAIERLEPGSVPAKSIIIYRYYDLVSSTFGRGEQIKMEKFGEGLNELIEKLRDRICDDNDEERAKFKVYLVGHSMGGLVIRCFLQNDKIGNKAEELKGQAKESTGKATDDEHMEAEGKTDQAGANLKQAGEKVKDAFKG